MKSLILLGLVLVTGTANATCSQLALEKFESNFWYEKGLMGYLGRVVDRADKRNKYDNKEQLKRVGEYSLAIALGIATSPYLLGEMIVMEANAGRAENILNLTDPTWVYRDNSITQELARFSEGVYGRKATLAETTLVGTTLALMNIGEEFCFKRNGRIHLDRPAKIRKKIQSKLRVE